MRKASLERLDARFEERRPARRRPGARWLSCLQQVELRALRVGDRACRCGCSRSACRCRCRACRCTCPGSSPGRKPVASSRLRDRPPGHSDDEAGQVLVLGAQAVGDPRAHARPRQRALAAVHQQQRRLVVRDVGVHRADDADVVDARSPSCGSSSLTSMPLWPYFAKLERRGSRPAGLPLGAQVGRRRAACRRTSPAPAWGRTCRPATARRS